MKKQDLIVTGLIASFALWGVFEALADNRFTKLGGTLSLVHVVLIAGLIFWWGALDAEARSSRLGAGWKVALVLFGIASMPLYLYTTRPNDRRWISIAKGFGLFVAACMLYVTAYVLTGVYDA